MATCPSPIPISIESRWLRKGLAIAAEQSGGAFGKVALLNHLAMETVRNFLRWLEIPCDYDRDLPPEYLWGMLDFSELVVVDITHRLTGANGTLGGKILCRPVIVTEVGEEADDGALRCELPLDLSDETVACIPVGFDESLRWAWVWGYVPVAALELGVQGAREFRFEAMPWRSLDELAEDLDRWIGLSQALSNQTDLCDRLRALVGPVPLVSLVARWPRSPGGEGMTGAELLEEYWQDNLDPFELASSPSVPSSPPPPPEWDPLQTPLETLMYGELTPPPEPEEDYDDYCVLEDDRANISRPFIPPSVRVREGQNSSSSLYRLDEPEDETPVLDSVLDSLEGSRTTDDLEPGQTEMIPAPEVSPRGTVEDQLQAIAQELNQWFQTMEKGDKAGI